MRARVLFCFNPSSRITTFRTNRGEDYATKTTSVSIPLQGLQPFGPSSVNSLTSGMLSFQSLFKDYNLSDLGPVLGGTCPHPPVSIPLQGLQPFGPPCVIPSKVGWRRVSIPLQGLQPFGLSHAGLGRGGDCGRFNPSSRITTFRT